MTTRGAANYARVDPRTTRFYWEKAGLKPKHVHGGQKISEETESLIYTAWEMGLSGKKASEYLGVNSETVLKYWREAGLDTKRHIGKMRVVKLHDLLDGVFDTVNNLKEVLTRKQILERLGYKRVDEERFQEKLDEVVRLGFYEKFAGEDGIEKYRAGMPKAMNGSVKRE